MEDYEVFLPMCNFLEATNLVEEKPKACKVTHDNFDSTKVENGRKRKKESKKIKKIRRQNLDWPMRKYLIMEVLNWYGRGGVRLYKEETRNK